MSGRQLLSEALLLFFLIRVDHIHRALLGGCDRLGGSHPFKNFPCFSGYTDPFYACNDYEDLYSLFKYKVIQLQGKILLIHYHHYYSSYIINFAIIIIFLTYHDFCNLCWYNYKYV